MENLAASDSYTNLQVFSTIEEVSHLLTGQHLELIHFLRMVRFHLIEAGLESAQIPLTDLTQTLAETGIPASIALKFENIMKTDRANIHTVSFDILQKLELQLVQTQLIHLIENDKR